MQKPWKTQRKARRKTYSSDITLKNIYTYKMSKIDLPRVAACSVNLTWILSIVVKLILCTNGFGPSGFRSELSLWSGGFDIISIANCEHKYVKVLVTQCCFNKEVVNLSFRLKQTCSVRHQLISDAQISYMKFMYYRTTHARVVYEM